ncbi:hypothetical protein RHMOL_Rhmol02G0097800 [Rhododendron molle]|uniref:Uncharacterized protein n=1 Tax=Rhododendron molle TaxID=49168 RepID=A0ACC0PNU6_RHOML|nr:hypothetical protein RHMOL_Rhmol02G0097800 [Rhododendron molle]
MMNEQHLQPLQQVCKGATPPRAAAAAEAVAVRMAAATARSTRSPNRGPNNVVPFLPILYLPSIDSKYQADACMHPIYAAKPVLFWQCFFSKWVWAFLVYGYPLSTLVDAYRVLSHSYK